LGKEIVPTKTVIANPYQGVDISLIIPSKEYGLFETIFSSLTDTCSCPDKVEVLLKIDDFANSRYHKLLFEGPFRFKILVYPKYYSRLSIHWFFNNLCAISSGTFMWLLNDDAELVNSPDWYKIIMNTRNSYKDNIYYIGVPMDNGKGAKQIVSTPVITREWYNVLGMVAPTSNADRWLYELSKAIKRQVLLKENDILMHLPQGRRALSKSDRKKFFYPLLEKKIRKFKKIIK